MSTIPDDKYQVFIDRSQRKYFRLNNQKGNGKFYEIEDVTGGGSGGTGNIDSVTGNIVDNTDPANPIVTQVQTDWNQLNNAAIDFIKNKPALSGSQDITWSVINITNTPPGSPADGDTYLAGTAPTGAWSGEANQIEIWDAGGNVWNNTTAVTGDLLQNDNDQLIYKFNGTTWDLIGKAPLLAGGNSGIANLKAGTFTQHAFSLIQHNSKRLELLTNGSIKWTDLTGVGSGFLKVDASGVMSRDNNTYLTGNQTISFAPTGDVTGSTTGTTTLAPVLAIGANKVLDTMIRQSAGLSVIGRSANTTGNVADIIGTDGQILRVSGTSLGFGTIPVTSVTGISAVAPLTYTSGVISQRFNVRDYGATGDGKAVYDGVMSSTVNTTTFISATAAFVSGDVGKVFILKGAGTSGRDLVGTISSFTNSTTVILSTACLTTVSGADFTFGTDQTTFIQAAITAVTAAYGGTVLFPNGIYMIAGALQSSVGGIDMNAQIYIPYSAYTNTHRCHIRLMGETIPMFSISSGLSSGSAIPLMTSGVILRSTLSSGTTGFVIGTGTTSGFNDSGLTVESLTIQVRNNVTGNGPVCGGIGGSKLTWLSCKNVVVNVDTTGWASVLPVNDTTGIETPDNGGGSGYCLENTLVAGFRNGYKLGEHFTGNNIQAEYCYYAFNLKAGYHSSSSLRMVSQWNVYDLFISGASYFINLQLDTEWQSASKWYDNVNTIKDDSNLGHGSVFYDIVSAGVGHDQSKFSKSGGSNIFAVSADSQINGGGVTTMAAIGASANANGASISGSTLTLQPASISFGGVLTNGTQTIAGAKTFANAPTFSSIAANKVLISGTGGLVVESTLYWDLANGRLGVAVSPTYPLDVSGISNTTVHIRGTAATGDGSVYIENDRGSFANYVFLATEGQSISGTWLGATKADMSFLLTGGASSAGLGIGTLTAKPIIFGTNNAEVARFISGGQFGIGLTPTKAWLEIKAGTTTAAAITLTSGTNKTTPVSGDIEYDNTFYMTQSDATRRNVVLAANATKTTAGAPYANDGYITVRIGGTDVKVMTTA